MYSLATQRRSRFVEERGSSEEVSARAWTPRGTLGIRSSVLAVSPTVRLQRRRVTVVAALDTHAGEEGTPPRTSVPPSPLLAFVVVVSRASIQLSSLL
ncbi:hypothetical protein V5799_023033 [Amblyomma americanum]|uniref:Uncharacterized protein n=1 Tax=Amblyomma americanum TaxID=6943 RepID=A0AAQ4FKG7_AMBAM